MRFLSKMSLTLLCTAVLSITAHADEPITLIGAIVKWRYPDAEIGQSQMSDAATIDAAVEARPRTFMGYLRPELPIGVQSVQGTSDVIIHVYTSGDYETAAVLVENRSVRLASEVAETNDAVREQLTAYIKEHEIPESEVESLGLMPLTRTSLATIRVVGNDYVLVELRSNSKTKRRKLIPKSRIGAIYLDANPVQFARPSRPARRDRG